MSAFQDFGPLSERRRAEKQQTRRKHIMMAGGAVSVIIIIAAVAAVAVIFINKNNDNNNDNNNNNNNKNSKKPASGGSPGPTVTSSKMVDLVCSEASSKDICMTKLTRATKPTSKPKDVVKASVSVVYDAAIEAFEKASEFKTGDPMTKEAVSVCEELLLHSKDDLNDTINRIEVFKLQDLPKISPVLNVWLSAVRSYQETCIDAFPEGEAKNKMKEAMKAVNELTGNALGIVSKAANYLATLNVPGHQRRLLSEDEATPALDEEGFPEWVEDGDRRALKENPAAVLKPNVVVAQDGSGQFKTINEALAAIPPKYEGRYVIYVKAGTYDEQVIIDKKMLNVTMYGEGNTKTIVTGNKNYKAGVQTFNTATFAVVGDGFMGLNMGFINTAGPEGEQAVALRVQGDSAVFLNCRMEAYQDTLYAQAKRQFYRNCIITGTVDYLFGDAAAVFQSCVFAVRKPGPGQQNIVTAHGRIDPDEQTGFVLHNCRIIPSDDLTPVVAEFKSYLARPWKAYSRTVIMESEIGKFIDPVGYLPWGDTTVGQDTCEYAEYKNTGEGANTATRAGWKGVKKELSKEEASKFVPSAFLVDVAFWSKKSGVSVPLRLGFFQ